jgi:hypothetical protein
MKWGIVAGGRDEDTTVREKIQEIHLGKGQNVV